MGLDLTIYEVESVNSEVRVKIVSKLDNSTAMLLVNWLYRNDDAKLTGNYLKLNGVYQEINGDKLKQALDNLSKIIIADDKDKDTYASYYFPCLNTLDGYLSSLEMFSTGYYDAIYDLYAVLSHIIYYKPDTILEDRLFLYNISW